LSLPIIGQRYSASRVSKIGSRDNAVQIAREPSANVIDGEDFRTASLAEFSLVCEGRLYRRQSLTHAIKKPGCRLALFLKA
jgi:hypothetical protein